MHASLRYAAAIFIGVGMLAPAQAETDQALVRAAENGQAFLFTRLGVCYAVVPTHVMGKTNYAQLVGKRPDAPLLGEGDEIVRSSETDLAILRVSGELERYCGSNFALPADLEDLLIVEAHAEILSVNTDGTLSRYPCVIIDVGPKFIQATTQNEELHKGLSGSILVIKGRNAGVLMNLRTGGSMRLANLLRFDQMMDIVGGFFGDTSRQNGFAVRSPPVVTGHPRKGIDPHDLAAAPHGGRVVGWSAAAVDADHRAINLVDAPSAGTLWRVAKPKFPLQVTVRLAGHGVTRISRVELDGEGTFDARELPRDVEILAAVDETSGYRSIASTSVDHLKRNAEVRFRPTVGALVRIRIYNNWGSRDYLTLNSVHVYAE